MALAALKRSTKGNVFAGTPHRGADKAKLASIDRNLAILHTERPIKRIRDSLKQGDGGLKRLQKPFGYILRKFAPYTLLEELEYPKIGTVRVSCEVPYVSYRGLSKALIVEKDSAVLGERDERMPHTWRPFFHDQVSSREDEGYKDICHIIRVILKDWTGVRESSKRISSVRTRWTAS